MHAFFMKYSITFILSCFLFDDMIQGNGYSAKQNVIGKIRHITIHKKLNEGLGISIVVSK